MPRSLDLKRGDTVLVLFPNSDLRTAKTRPALVVQANGLDTGVPQVIMAMISSQMFRAGHPSRVTIRISSTEGERSGLLFDSVVMTDNLATVLNAAITELIGSIEMTAVERALRHTLGL
jgi:mRNA interferase MazF